MTTLFLSRSHVSIARTISPSASTCLSSRTVRLGSQPQRMALSAVWGHGLQLHSQLHSPQEEQAPVGGSQPAARVGTGWALRWLPTQAIHSSIQISLRDSVETYFCVRKTNKQTNNLQGSRHSRTRTALIPCLPSPRATRKWRPGIWLLPAPDSARAPREGFSYLQLVYKQSKPKVYLKTGKRMQKEREATSIHPVSLQDRGCCSSSRQSAANHLLPCPAGPPVAAHPRVQSLHWCSKDALFHGLQLMLKGIHLERSGLSATSLCKTQMHHVCCTHYHPFTSCCSCGLLAPCISQRSPKRNTMFSRRKMGETI